MNFDEYFSEFAYTARIKSKDPSSQIGAIIVGPDNQLISAGFNGFPRGVDESNPLRWERPIKYEYVCHAEENAIYNAARHGIALRGATLYLAGFGPPTVPCTHCAKAVIQSGIARVVGRPYKEARPEWIHDLNFAWNLLDEAGVEVVELPPRPPTMVLDTSNAQMIPYHPEPVRKPTEVELVCENNRRRNEGLPTLGMSGEGYAIDLRTGKTVTIPTYDEIMLARKEADAKWKPKNSRDRQQRSRNDRRPNILHKL